MKPRWQKARILQPGKLPELMGREIWVKDKPEIRVARNMDTGVVLPPAPRYRTNILSRNPGRRIVLRHGRVELIANSEGDFADDVPMVKWSEFIK